MVEQKEITLPAFSRGFHLIDSFIEKGFETWPEKGICNIFIKHTSAAIAINEGADPDVRKDLRKIYDSLVRENQSWYSHTDEGPDDMPSHAKAVLTGCSLT